MFGKPKFLRRLPFFCCTALSLFWTVAAAAQSAPAGPDSRKYTLEGTVINLVTSAPLARVLVEIMGNSQRTALTDQDGRFQFEGMTAGQQVIVARKPGFYGSRNESRRNGSYLTMDLGPQTGPITIKMIPESIISGHVENADGDPLENALVRVLTPFMKQGRRQWMPQSQAVTDADGNFRVAGLFSRFQVELQANRARSDSKEGYPAVVYYPGVYDMSSAMPLQLAHGQQMDLQFQVKRESVFKLSGTISGQGAAEDVNVRIRTRSGEDVFLTRSTSRQPGTFEITGIPAGTYVIEGRTRRNNNSNNNSPVLYGELPVTVTGNMTGLHLTVRPILPVPISVRAESTLPPAEGQTDAAVVARSVRVQFHSTDLAFRDNQSSYDTRDDRQVMEVRDLFPGSYVVEINSWGRWYLQSARSGSVNLLHDLLVVPRNAGVEPIELVLRDDGGTVTGTVRADKPEFAAVLVAPEFAPMQPPRIVTADRGGHFTVDSLAPGNYRVFAFDSLEQLEYSNPQALRQYDSKAVRVSVVPGGSADLSLELIQAGEP